MSQEKTQPIRPTERTHTVGAKIRVQRFRDQLRGQECGRLEVWIGRGWIRNARFIAQHQKRPLWALVEDAIKAYVAQHARIIRPIKDRDRTRSFKQKEGTG